MIAWKTTPIDPSPVSPKTPWRRSLGEVCPHGLELFLVDGTFIRNHYDSDFVQGGNGQRYRFCPKSQLWLDDSLPESEWPYVAFHECYETDLMEKGYSYERAHNCAKRAENKFRRVNSPGKNYVQEEGRR